MPPPMASLPKTQFFLVAQEAARILARPAIGLRHRQTEVTKVVLLHRTALSEQLARRPPAAIVCPDEEPLRLFQQLTGGDPAGYDDVGQIPAVGIFDS
jgi:hypothetical protein